ncbi:hypothetical protein [Desulfonema magnum]|uniref:Uncharacterized protein n=1 Tax=Desulfonema magnum TaxID=45655 RepID=A0A975BFN6_9BACT|nr:hypothetical protein [Desulfonema magnum]QTA84425.1 Uncharacterized protein dnm_004210 [Desulfonema magnum]
MSVNIRSALENLKEEDIDRLRLKLRRRFGEQLRKIPTIPDMAKFPSRDTEALFQEAVKDLLEDRRRCPTETKKALLGCLYNIVRSKVSHIQSKWNDVKKRKKERQNGYALENQPANIYGRKINQHDLGKSSDAVVQQITSDAYQSKLHEQILSLVEDDALLKQIIEYQIDSGGPVKAQKIADALGVGIEEIYNANKRLKARLKKINKEYRGRYYV